MPSRIISLVPSKTELLYDLGLRDEVVGITKFCVHPEEWFRSKARVGGTKTVDIEKTKSLAPDLVIANKEENVKEQVEALSEFAPVYVSDIKNLEDALEMIKHVGKLVNREKEANTLTENISSKFEQLKNFIQPVNQQDNLSTPQPVNLSTPDSYRDQPPNTAYLIWKDPYMAAGGDTFIHDMLHRCGFKNIFEHINRYPQITIEQLNASTSDSYRKQPFNLSTSQPINHSTIQPINPSTIQPFNHSTLQLLLLSSEPYPFKQKHIDELQQQLAGTKILLVDGEMFSWYGSRLAHAPKYFIKLLKEINSLF